LLAVSVDENNSFAVRAVLAKALKELKSYIELQMKPSTGAYAGHLQLALERMKNPSAAKPTLHKEAPPGAPIGCEED
ncbi:MAG: hypothetical protein GXC73_00805, partial [Chitinophagaceae bacterium]|nr:hypothetical protein [Chitinophagaceae bacterium]